MVTSNARNLRGKRAISKTATALIEALEARFLLAFGLTTTTGSYTVDTGGGVVFSILRSGGLSSTVHVGDMTSFAFNGNNYAAPYAQESRYSHFESGLSNPVNGSGGAALSATIDPSATPNWILVTCDDTTATAGANGTGVIQYYMAKRNDPIIYMATYAPVMLVSSTRYIAYLDGTKFTNRPAPSDNTGGTGAVESSDVNGHADGTTTSKYYGETRNIDHTYHGATGAGVGAFMFTGNRERGAGGPFWKDIDWQSGSSVEIYNIPYSDHSLTDPFRPGLHGPYALELTNGSPPAITPDYSFMDPMGLTGWVSASGRGTLSGHTTGVAAGHIVTVALSNTAAQYWANPDAAGNYTIPGILPGTYTETLYDEELGVALRTITITAAQTTRADITAMGYVEVNPATNTNTLYPSAVTPIWQIGTWDGTPREFLNGENTTIMHPSDIRMSPWADSTGITNFTVGVDSASSFPMAEWHTQVGTGTGPYYGVQNRITFTLTAAQAAVAMTLRIGLTRSDSERPDISVNGGSSAAIQNITTQADGRGVTLGNWRGNNALYSFNLSTSSVHAGTNYIDIYSISGSTGNLYSVYHIYDAIDLIPTSQAAMPAITSLTVSPATGVNIGASGSRVFTALGNTTLPVNATWTSTIGSINDAGEFTAPAAAGSGTVTATYGSITKSVTVNVIATAPIIASPASASPNPTYNKTTTLSVLGADDAGEAGLTYTWATVGTQPGTVTFTGSTNGTNAAKNITATFSAYGTYTLQATITDATGNTTVSQIRVVAQDVKNWYKFDQPNGDALTDSSGNTQFGTAFGNFSTAAGVNSGALNLTAGGATLPAGIVAGLNDFTIAAWVKPSTLNNWARVFDFGTGTSSYMFLASRTSATGNPIQFSITTTGSAGEQKVIGPILANGVWTHLAITLSGSTATLYVNGLAVATNSAVTLRPSSLGITNLNYLGVSQYAADPDFQGAIDDFRIYGRALTSTEISNLARPTIATTAAANPLTAIGATTSLSVLGADINTSASALTYTWSLTGTPPAAVTYSTNGTNAAQTTIATFTKAGTYNFLVTVTNAVGLTTTSSVSVAVNATITTISVSPSIAAIITGSTLPFTATVYDQFGNVIPSASVIWSATGGSVTGAGVFTAGQTGGVFSVKATSALVSGATAVTIVPTNYPSTAGDGFYLELAADQITDQIWLGTPGLIGPGFSSPSYSILLSNLPALTFGPGSSANGVLTIDSTNGSPIPANGISFDGGLGIDTLNLIGSSASDNVTVSSSSLTLGGRIATYSNIEAINITLAGGINSLTQTSQPGNGATLTLLDPSTSDTLNISGGVFTLPVLNTTAGIVSFPLSNLFIGAGASVIAPAASLPANRYLLMPAVLSIAGTAGAWTGRLDLGSSDLDTGPLLTLANLQSLLSQGYNNGQWNGNGITSTAAAVDPTHLTAPGGIQNNQTGFPLFTPANPFDRITPGISDLLIKYTYYGDANLDGKVDSSDYTNIDNGQSSHQTGWANGDFNHDGIVDGSDYALIDNSFNTQAASLTASLVQASSIIAALPAAIPWPQVKQPATYPKPKVFKPADLEIHDHIRMHIIHQVEPVMVTVFAIHPPIRTTRVRIKTPHIQM